MNQVISSEHNHGFAFADAAVPALHLLVGLRSPRSATGAADGAFVAAQPDEGGTIHTCLFVDGIRFTGTTTREQLDARIRFLTATVGWAFLSKTDMRLVCFGMSHVCERDIFWGPEYKDQGLF